VSLKPGIGDLLRMGAGAGVMLVLVLLVLHYQSERSPAQQVSDKVHRSNLVERMRYSLAAASEAEKSAVLAVTDQDSEAFADQARAATAEVERLRTTLGESLGASAGQKEKELLARFIHQASNRSRKPFVAVNCAAVPEHLLESELFGHARGAFTGASAAKAGKFELANGGTLLLDEIGEMPLNLQPKLLRILQEREFERLGETRSIHVDIRVIATTNASLGSMVEQGRFRSDLYYRLNVIPLSLPTLRERLEDIPALAKYFAERFAAEMDNPIPRIDPSFIERLQSYDWPGNIRELANFMRRVLSLHQGATIDAACFYKEFQPIGRTQPAPFAMPAPGTPIAVLEKAHLENTLALAHGNRTHAAVMLGISLRTMRNKIREYGLPPRSYA